MNFTTLWKIGAFLLAVASIFVLVVMAAESEERIDSFCEDRGFETGRYYTDAEGTYCWNHITKVRPNGVEYKTQTAPEFFPNEIKPQSDNKKTGEKNGSN